MQLRSPVSLPIGRPQISGFSELSDKSKFYAEAGLIFVHITIPLTAEGIIDPDPSVLGAFQKARNAGFCQHLRESRLLADPKLSPFPRPSETIIAPPIDREISD
jgi:hypothetical protein